MKNQILFIILCLGSCFLYLDSYSQITRGAQPHEIYMSNDWYWDGYIMHRAVFRSADNGEHISIQYTSTNPPMGEDMMIGTLVGDANPGALYNYGDNELWVSFDYSESWNNLHYFSILGRYTSGCVPGEIYRCCTDVQGTIWRSEDYGNEFIEITDDVKYILEVGNSQGNVFGFGGLAGIGFDLFFSNNYAVLFDTIPIDSAVAYYEPSGQYPKISRGTEPGELFLVSWWPASHYKIFHSVDTGYTWIQKYESEDINLYYWGVSFTAGREPGSFYVVRSTGDPTLSHLWLYIDYSDDYGETFTTYFHDLDSTYTDVKSWHYEKIELSNAPNPFKNQTTFNFILPENCYQPVLSIYNLRGDLIKQYNISGKTTQQWDGSDTKGNLVSKGIYLYNIKYDNFSSQFNKLILSN